MLTRFADPKMRRSDEFRRNAGQALRELKGEYARIYLAAHAKHRLGAAGQAQRRRLLASARLKGLAKLCAIELLPKRQLDDYRERLKGLAACTVLMESELRAAPVCGHCGFRLGVGDSGPSAESVLDALDQEADRMLTRWSDTLLENLADSTAQESLKLLEPAAKALVDRFVATGRLAQDPEQELIDALAEALAGLEKVSVRRAELCAAVAPDGAPSTPSDMVKRLARLVGGPGRRTGREQGQDRAGGRMTRGEVDGGSYRRGTGLVTDQAAAPKGGLVTAGVTNLTGRRNLIIH